MLEAKKLPIWKGLIITKAGTHSLQFLIDLLPAEDINKIYSNVVENNFLEICNNEFGFHFVQKMLYRLDTAQFVEKIKENLGE